MMCQAQAGGEQDTHLARWNYGGKSGLNQMKGVGGEEGGEIWVRRYKHDLCDLKM